MNGELIYTDAAGNEARLPGYATFESEELVRWEIHDRELDEAEIRAALEELARVKGSDSRVQVIYINPGQLLDEVESGPDHIVDLSEPLAYRIGEIHADDGWLELLKA